MKKRICIIVSHVKEGPATIIDETYIYLPPLSVNRLEVECSGEYEGTGSMVRHPPESIKLKLLEDCRIFRNQQAVKEK